MLAAEKSPKTYSVSSGRSGRSERPATKRRTLWQRLRELGPGLVIIIVLIAGLSGYAGARLQGGDIGPSNSSLSNEKRIVSSQGQLINQIAKSVGPSVVSVNVDLTDSSPSDPFGPFDSAPSTEKAAGTGVIINSSGLILTNRHVVPDTATSVSVTLSDGTELKNVSVVGRTNPQDSLDVAFLKIQNSQGHKLIPANLGNSSTIQVGDSVVAIGNALGQFQNTVTSGIISGYGRNVRAGDSSGSQATESLTDLLQTDAAINEGNSGGPLVNLNGQVIGLNTAIAGDAQAIGFAIPINNIRGLIDQVVASGKFSRPYLGVRYVQLTAEIASSLGLPVQTGAYVAPSNDPANPSVITGGPAAQAGIVEKDVIVAVNGKKIDQTHNLSSQLTQYKPGNRVKLTVLRDKKTLTIDVTLGTMPQQ